MADSANSNLEPFFIEQGSSKTWTFPLFYEDGTVFDPSACDLRMQVRRTYGATTALINATLANNKLAKTTSAVQLALTPADTVDIRFTDKDDETLECVFDIEMVMPSGYTFKLARGPFTITREVTR